jgi:hypothetical protein
MADVQTRQSLLGPYFEDNYVVTKEDKCVCCYKLEQELTTALQELKSARKIIRILQEDLNTDLDSVSTKENASNSNPHFKTVFTKHRGRRLNNAQ